MSAWGPFAHIKDGEIGDAEIHLARDAIHEFAHRIAAPMGMMASMVGMDRDERCAEAASIGREIAEIAAEIWSEHFNSDPDWERKAFSSDVANMIEEQAGGPSFHFGDTDLKELVITL